MVANDVGPLESVADGEAPFEAGCGRHAAACGLTAITVTRAFWLKVITKQASITDLLFSNELQVEGSRTKLVSFFSLLDDPNPNFAIVTP